MFVKDMRRAVLLFAFVLFLALPGQAVAALFEYESAFGSPGTGTGRFLAPAGVATDEAGRVYVADTASGRVEVYDNATDQNRYLGVIGKEQIQAPVGLWIDVRQRLYVADAARHTVLQFDPFLDGSTLRREFGTPNIPGAEVGRLWQPRFVTVDRGGLIYVTERDNVRVQWFRPTRSNGQKAIAAFGTAEPTGFDRPEGIVRDADGRIYVSGEDAGGGTMRVYDERGAFIRALAGPGSALGQLAAPRGLARDFFGRTLVADAGNGRIQVFGPLENGAAPIETYGASGSGPGQFGRPSALAVAPGALVYVADPGNGRVVRLRYDDADRDGALDGRDTCQGTEDGDQRDADRDGQGDACDLDDDNDGTPDAQDQCPRSRRGVDGNGDGCGDPRSRISAPRERRTYTRRGGVPSRVVGTAVADELGVQGVEIALARVTGRRCAWYGGGGRFGRAGSCAAPTFMPASGQRRWAVPLRLRARGTYRVISRATQVGGLVEARQDRSNRRTFRVR